MSDWIHGPFSASAIPLRPFLAWHCGQVRSVGRSPFLAGLVFTDCTHPLQNVVCDVQDIDALRLEKA